MRVIMKTSIFTFLTVVIVITVPGQSVAKEKRASFDDGLDSQIRSATREWQRMVTRRNAEALAKYYSNYCVYMKQGERSAYHKADIISLYEKWFKSGIVSCEVEELGFRELSGKHAYVWGTYTSYAKGRKGQGNIEAESGTYVQLFERAKGGFKIIVEGRTVNDIRSGGLNNTSTC